MIPVSFELPPDVPACGLHSEAARFVSEQSFLAPPPPSSANSLPSEWAIERRGDLIILRDMVGDGFSRDGLDYNGLSDAFRYFYQVFPDDFDFVTVITNQESTYGMGSFAFYSPLDNDTRGIGQTTYSSGMTLQGLLFMNAWWYWEGGSDTFTSAVFGQEFGHRWGSYVSYDLGSGARDDILGRDDAHWSYWLETSNSPMEGNAWTDEGGGDFSLDAQEDVAYSDLDLYLMGLIGPDDVAPFFLIDDPAGLARSAASAPEYYDSMRDQSATGTRVDITVDDIIRAAGDRSPAVGQAPTSFTMAVVLLLGKDDQPDDNTVEGADEVRLRFEEVWEEDTRFLGDLDVSAGTLELDPVDPALFTAPAVMPKGAW